MDSKNHSLAACNFLKNTRHIYQYSGARHCAIPATFFLLVLSEVAYGSVQSELACSIGYRADAIIQRYTSSTLSNRVEFNDIHSVAVEINYIASFNHNLYLRGMGLLAEAPGCLQKKHYQANVEILAAKGGKSHIQSWLGSIGWQFDFDHGRYAWCLETGWLYNGIKYTYETHHHLKLYAPFVGTLLHFPLNHRWYVECDLDYTFSSSRYERVEGIDFNTGSFQGPRGGLALGCHFNEHISCALDWKTFYFFSKHSSVGNIDHERTRWQMQQLTAQFSYRF